MAILAASLRRPHLQSQASGKYLFYLDHPYRRMGLMSVRMPSETYFNISTISPLKSEYDLHVG
jgi:hypothetical protein